MSRYPALKVQSAINRETLENKRSPEFSANIAFQQRRELLETVNIRHEYRDLSCDVILRMYVSIEFIARSLLPLFDARGVMMPRHFRVRNKVYPVSSDNC